MKIRTISAGILLLAIGSGYSALAQYVAIDELEGPSSHDEYSIADWRHAITAARVQYQTFRSAVLADPEISYSEKVKLVTGKYDEIRSAFVANRAGLYKSYNEVISVPHSCTKGNSGGTKDCGDKCASPAAKFLYTQASWATVASKDGSDKAGENLFKSGNIKDSSRYIGNGNQICTPELKKSGKGRKVAFAKATFRLPAGKVDSFTASEADAFMHYVTKSPI